MPFVETPDLRVHYRLDGPVDAPLLVFSNPLGTNLSTWDPQMPALEKLFRVLRYDARGHGQTAVTPGPYSIAQLAGDLLHVLDILQLGHAHFCGLSMGGQVGIWLGAHAPDRFDRIALCNTAARIGNVETWNGRIEEIRRSGLPAFAHTAMERWFTPEFRERAPEIVARSRAMVETTPVEGYLACCAALRDADLNADLPRIRLPTLVIAGSTDPATPAVLGRALADAIAGARYVEFPVSHLSNIEAASEFSAALISFLTASPGAP